MSKTLYLEGKTITVMAQGTDPETGKLREWPHSFDQAKLTLTPDWAILSGVPSGRTVVTEVQCWPREQVSTIMVEPFDSVISRFYGQDESK